jgi:hypothetical protein
MFATITEHLVDPYRRLGFAQADAHLGLPQCFCDFFFKLGGSATGFLFFGFVQRLMTSLPASKLLTNPDAK